MTERVRKRSSFEPAAALLGRDAPLATSAKRPLATTLGAVFVMGRALVGILWLVAFALIWGDVAAGAGLDSETTGILAACILGAGGFSVLLLVVLGGLIWRGSNTARVLVMLGLTMSITVAAIGYFAEGEEITIQTTLLTVALDILVLLALSSRDARAWARRPRRGN